MQISTTRLQSHSSHNSSPTLDRFIDTDIIDQLAGMDFSGTSVDLPALYGYTEMYDIAAHFSLDPDDMQIQWQDFIQLLNTMPTHDRSMTSLFHLLHNSDDTGLKNMYSLVYRLFSIATTISLSRAEVERVFSQVKLIKISHRSNIKTKLEAQWAEPVSLIFHSALRKLNREPSIETSHKILVHLTKQFQRRRFLEINHPKQEWPMAAMLANGSGRNEQFL